MGRNLIARARSLYRILKRHGYILLFYLSCLQCLTEGLFPSAKETPLHGPMFNKPKDGEQVGARPGRKNGNAGLVKVRPSNRPYRET